eukprot:38819-Eustigmatos_ZCMA.PRE.1
MMIRRRDGPWSLCSSAVSPNDLRLQHACRAGDDKRSQPVPWSHSTAASTIQYDADNRGVHHA